MPASTAPQETDALIDHILLRYHDAHREELAWLVSLSHKIESVHADHPQVPKGLGDILATLHEDMEEEMQHEEDEVFPLMRAGDTVALGAMLDRMRDDHRRHAAIFAQVAGLTEGLTLPADACRSWVALYDALGSFGADLHAHLTLENDVLIPRFAA